MASFAHQLLRVAAFGILCLGITTSGLTAEYQKIIDRKVFYHSPDRKMRAVVVYYQRYLYGAGESRVDIRDGQGRLVGSEDYTCGGTQGFRVKQTAWSADSRFFVFSVVNAGGHSPTYTPMTFYDVRRHRFYSVNTLAKNGMITNDHFRLAAPASLTVDTWDEKTTINLHHLTKKNRQAAAAEERDFIDRLRKNANQ